MLHGLCLTGEEYHPLNGITREHVLNLSNINIRIGLEYVGITISSTFIHRPLDRFAQRCQVVMLVGNTLSPKIQATLNVGERRFCVNVPLQAAVKRW